MASKDRITFFQAILQKNITVLQELNPALPVSEESCASFLHRILMQVHVGLHTKLQKNLYKKLCARKHVRHATFLYKIFRAYRAYIGIITHQTAHKTRQ